MPVASRSLYFENSVGRIWEEPGGYLRLEYKPAARAEAAFHAILNHCAQALARQQWSRMLVDQRQMAPLSPAEQRWMSTEWLPRAVHEFGYRFGAVLVAHNVFARLAMTQLLLGTQDLPHTYRTFEDEGAAVAWLLEV